MNEFDHMVEELSPEPDRWVPITEKLPTLAYTIDPLADDCGMTFIVVLEDGSVTTNIFWAVSRKFDYDDVAYWRSMPAAPKERDG